MTDGPNGFMHTDDHDPERATVRFARRLATSPADVWSALTDPSRLARWLAPATIEPGVGGSVQIDFGPGQESGGEILAWDPPRLLEHAWHFTGEEESIVRYELTPDGDGTILVVEHRRLAKPFAGGYTPGWHAYLDRLGALLAGNDLPDWDQRYAEAARHYA